MPPEDTAKRPRKSGRRGYRGESEREDEVTFRYPLFLNHEWGLTILIVGGCYTLWWLSLDIRGLRWDDPSALLTDALYGVLALGALLGQLRCSYYAIQQPWRFVFRGGLFEVRWRGRLWRYRPDQISVGEVGEIPIPYYRGVQVTTPDGPFYVTTRLRQFDRFVALLREWSRGAPGGGLARGRT